MKTVSTILLILLALGCKKSGYNQNEMVRLTESEKKVVGKWTLERSFGKGEEDLKKVMEMVDGMGSPVELECFPNKSYGLVVLKVPVKGTWAVIGTEVRLTIEKVGEMRPEDITRVATKNRGVSGWDMGSVQRDEYLKGVTNSLALTSAEDLSLLQIGVDGKSLYVARNKETLFGSTIRVFKPSK